MVHQSVYFFDSPMAGRLISDQGQKGKILQKYDASSQSIM